MSTVLMACTHPYWSHIQVGSQHLARQFAARGYDVHYFSAPVTPLHLFRLNFPEVTKRYQQACKNPWCDPQDRITTHIPFSLVAPDGMPVLRSQFICNLWPKTVVPRMRIQLARNNLHKVDILYIDNLSYHFLLDYVRYDTAIFRVMDVHENVPGWRGRAQKQIGRAHV